MNKLDYVDALNFNGNGSINDIFEQLGRIDAPTRQFTADENHSAVELKATTVRVPVDLLGAFDATLNHFSLRAKMPLPICCTSLLLIRFQVIALVSLL